MTKQGRDEFLKATWKTMSPKEREECFKLTRLVLTGQVQKVNIFAFYKDEESRLKMWDISAHYMLESQGLPLIPLLVSEMVKIIEQCYWLLVNRMIDQANHKTLQEIITKQEGYEGQRLSKEECRDFYTFLILSGIV